MRTKKTFATLLIERRDQKLYREVRKIIIKENDKGNNSILLLPHRLDNYAISALDVDGIILDKVIDGDRKKWRLSWPRN